MPPTGTLQWRGKHTARANTQLAPVARLLAYQYPVPTSRHVTYPRLVIGIDHPSHSSSIPVEPEYYLVVFSYTEV